MVRFSTDSGLVVGEISYLPIIPGSSFVCALYFTRYILRDQVHRPERDLGLGLQT